MLDLCSCRPFSLTHVCRHALVDSCVRMKPWRTNWQTLFPAARGGGEDLPSWRRRIIHNYSTPEYLKCRVERARPHQPTANIADLFLPKLHYGYVLLAKKLERVTFLCLLCSKTLPFQKLQLWRAVYSTLSLFHTDNVPWKSPTKAPSLLHFCTIARSQPACSPNSVSGHPSWSGWLLTETMCHQNFTPQAHRDLWYYPCVKLNGRSTGNQPQRCSHRTVRWL